MASSTVTSRWMHATAQFCVQICRCWIRPNRYAGPSRVYTEPGAVTSETKGQKSPYAPLPIGRDRASPLSTPQKAAGSRPLHRGQRLWGLRGMRGGAERTRTVCQARSHIEPVSVKSPCLVCVRRRASAVGLVSPSNANSRPLSHILSGLRYPF